MKVIDLRQTGDVRTEDWQAFLARPVLEKEKLEQNVSSIMAQVRDQGDEAIIRFSQQFDGVALHDLRVNERERAHAASLVDAGLKEAMAIAKKQIEAFHQSQLFTEQPVETMPGVVCWRRSVAIEKVGLYIPGGTAPLFSTLLMLAIPARMAGCEEIILCSPPGRNGSLHPAILYAAELAGVNRIFKAGGAQAIAAMAYGTATIPKVYKIFGPGNQYVTCAKQLLQKEGVAIDMPAGPSEVAVYADESANPVFVAADLLSQAEHGADSQVILVSASSEVLNRILSQVDSQVEGLPRAPIAKKALEQSRAFLVKDARQAMDLLNEYAPEHLILASDEAGALAGRVVNAGSVFLGHYSPESAGDYASGTNHVLPTHGYAKAYSGVSLDSFVKKITFQQLTRQGAQDLGRAVTLMAEAEGLEAHAAAMRVRMNG